MFKKLNVFFISGLLICSSAIAQQSSPEWISVAGASDLSWELQKGSGNISTFNGKPKSSVSYVLQKTNKKSNTYTYEKVFVELESCKRGYGHNNYNTMEGEFKSKDQFVRFGPTVADQIGTTACSIWDNITGKPSRVANNDSWKVVSTGEKSGDTFSIKVDTIRKKKFKKNPSLSVLKKFYQAVGAKHYYTELVFSVDGCKNGVGTAYELDFDGTVTNKFDVALNGKSMDSAVVNALCNM